MDRGDTEATASAARLARMSRWLLRRSPTDRELVRAVELLAARTFVPPHDPTLPQGSPAQVAVALADRTPEERTALAHALVALPDPTREPDLAARTLELLLATAGERERAARLLEAMDGHADQGQLALWRFRLTVDSLLEADDDGPEAWEPALDVARSVGGAALASALRMAASHLLAHASAHGAEWLVPVAGGRRIVNATLAAARRPALRHELGLIYDWLDEADDAEGGLEIPDPTEARLAAAEVADAGGDLLAGTEHVEEALARSGGRLDVATAMAARAALLQDSALAARARTRGAGSGWSPVEVRPIEAPSVAAPKAPGTGWSDRITTAEEQEPAFLEAVGSRSRAASAWLRDDSTDALLQAWRLRSALAPEALERLVVGLRARVSDDELDLRGDADPAMPLLARALHGLLAPGLERRLLALRLRAAEQTGGSDAELPGDTPSTDEDDPHGAGSRCAAAADLMDAGRPEAAATVLAALVRRCDDDNVVPRLVALVARLLQSESPPPALASAVERCVLGGGVVGEALLTTLERDSLAAYALHASLHRAACERSRPDPMRVRLLVAWLGIWAATQTPPASETLVALMHTDVALLPLAAAQLAGGPDPVTDAARFLTEHPPLETAPERYGAALLDLALPAGH